MQLSGVIDAVREKIAHTSNNGLAGHVDSARQYIQNSGKYLISVVGGVHTGAKVFVDPGTITIGRDASNNIVLFADDIEEQHVQLDLSAKYLQPIMVTPVNGSCRLDDGSIVDIGQYAEIDSGETIYFSNAALHISRVTSPKSVMNTAIKGAAILAIILIVPLAYSLFSNLFVGAAGAGSKFFSSINHEISVQSDQYLGTQFASAGEPSEKMVKEFTWATRAQLEDLKLNHRLQADSTADGSIRVFGTISDKESARWTSFLRWYDTKTGFPPLIRDVQSVGEQRDLPEIKSVWLGLEPTAIMQDGSIVKIGSQIRGGWKVITINKNGMTIERDGSTVSLTY